MRWCARRYSQYYRFGVWRKLYCTILRNLVVDGREKRVLITASSSLLDGHQTYEFSHSFLLLLASKLSKQYVCSSIHECSFTWATRKIINDTNCDVEQLHFSDWSIMDDDNDNLDTINPMMMIILLQNGSDRWVYYLWIIHYAGSTSTQAPHHVHNVPLTNLGPFLPPRWPNTSHPQRKNFYYVLVPPHICPTLSNAKERLGERERERERERPPAEHRLANPTRRQATKGCVRVNLKLWYIKSTTSISVGGGRKNRTEAETYFTLWGDSPTSATYRKLKIKLNQQVAV